MPKAVRVSITDEQGVVLDHFTLRHWTCRDVDEDGVEFCGSPASNMELVNRMVATLRRIENG